MIPFVTEVWEEGRDGAELLETSEHLGQRAQAGRGGHQEPSPQLLKRTKRGLVGEEVRDKSGRETSEASEVTRVAK